MTQIWPYYNYTMNGKNSYVMYQNKNIKTSETQHISEWSLQGSFFLSYNANQYDRQNTLLTELSCHQKAIIFKIRSTLIRFFKKEMYQEHMPFKNCIIIFFNCWLFFYIIVLSVFYSALFRVTFWEMGSCINVMNKQTNRLRRF